MEEGMMSDAAEIKPSKTIHEGEKVNVYGLLTVASVFGQLPPSYAPPYTRTDRSSLPVETIQHAILLLMKMSMDSTVGDDLHETVEASLSTLLQSLPDSAHTTLLHTIPPLIPEKHLQVHLLQRLPIHPLRTAQFRQNLAKTFLQIPLVPPRALLVALRTQAPFTHIARDITNEHVRQVRHAAQIFEIAFGWYGRDRGLMEDVVRELKGMNMRILDDGASSIVRTETKDVIQRVWMALECSLPSARQGTIEGMWR
jgi:hypothetical protein